MTDLSQQESLQFAEGHSVQKITQKFENWTDDWLAYADNIGLRQARTVSQAVELVKSSGILNRDITNARFCMTAQISKRGLSKMESEKATEKSVSPRLHALAIANIDKLFESAVLKYSHPDTHRRKEVTQTHRLGTLLLDTETFFFIPVMLTVIEYKKDGNRIYSIEAIDIAQKENSAGQLAAVAESERQAPIAEFINKIIYYSQNVNLELATKKQRK